MSLLQKITWPTSIIEMIPDKVIQDWVKNKKRIQDRLNRIKKRLKKYNKQLAHYEMRLRAIQKHEGSK